MDNLGKLKEIAKDLSVLYAEDDEFIGNTTNIMFQSIFKNSLLVDNGQKALNAFKENNYDLVVTDVKMPVMNGYELAMELKRIAKDLPIMITSAFINKEMSEKFKKKGIFYLKKPFNLDELVLALFDMLK